MKFPPNPPIGCSKEKMANYIDETERVKTALRKYLQEVFKDAKKHRAPKGFFPNAFTGEYLLSKTLLEDWL